MIEFGKTLRAAREAKGLTTGQIAERTHMMVQTVEGLENENFSKIVAPIYGRGFVKLYCETVGLDPKPMVDAFMAIYSDRRAANAEPIPPPPPPPAASKTPQPEPEHTPAAPVAPEPPPKPAELDFGFPPPPPSPAPMPAPAPAAARRRRFRGPPLRRARNPRDIPRHDARARARDRRHPGTAGRSPAARARGRQAAAIGQCARGRDGASAARSPPAAAAEALLHRFRPLNGTRKEKIRWKS